MNRTFQISIILFLILSSCRIPYDSDVDANKQILVIDAFITNYTGNSYVKLTNAIPYDSAGIYPNVRNAVVYFVDNTDSVFNFIETSAGTYEPVDYNFKGVINKTYTLTVTTIDGYVYVSKPEMMMPVLEPSNVYGGYDQEQYIEYDYYGQAQLITKDVCAVYFDYLSDNETAPRFRYNSSQIVEYVIRIIGPEGMSSFYCWKTEFDLSLRFTNDKYASSSINIVKQEICTSPPNIMISVSEIIPDPEGVSPTGWINGNLIDLNEYKRVAIINQFRLNNDSYKFFKGVEKQSSGDGKIFDPVISQLVGNITCKTDSTKLVLGFFEASTKTTMSFIVNRNGVGSSVNIIRINNITPPLTSAGFTLNYLPDFWVH